jgi:hypothetical protein
MRLHFQLVDAKSLLLLSSLTIQTQQERLQLQTNYL